jgi:ABC-type nitrate/sulfonate/bicarbonate transport system substrate-binding protein
MKYEHLLFALFVLGAVLWLRRSSPTAVAQRSTPGQSTPGTIGWSPVTSYIPLSVGIG